MPSKINELVATVTRNMSEVKRLTKKAVYIDLAEALSEIADKEPPYTHEYIMQVASGTKPGRVLAEAINQLYEKIQRDENKAAADADDLPRLFPVQMVLTRSQYEEILSVEDTKLRGELIVNAVKYYKFSKRYKESQ